MLGKLQKRRVGVGAAYARGGMGTNAKIFDLLCDSSEFEDSSSDSLEQGRRGGRVGRATGEMRKRGVNDKRPWKLKRIVALTPRAELLGET